MIRPILYGAASIMHEVGKADRDPTGDENMRHPQIPVDNLRSRRKALGLTQGAIAERAGVSRTTLSLIDRGMPVNLVTARAVENVLQEAEKG